MTDKTLTISADPSRQQILRFAERALRNAPAGTVTVGLVETLVEGMKDGLHALKAGGHTND